MDVFPAGRHRVMPKPMHETRFRRTGSRRPMEEHSHALFHLGNSLPAHLLHRRQVPVRISHLLSQVRDSGVLRGCTRVPRELHVMHFGGRALCSSVLLFCLSAAARPLLCSLCSCPLSNTCSIFLRVSACSSVLSFVVSCSRADLSCPAAERGLPSCLAESGVCVAKPGKTYGWHLRAPAVGCGRP